MLAYVFAINKIYDTRINAKIGYYEADLNNNRLEPGSTQTTLISWVESRVENLSASDFCPTTIEFFHPFSEEMVVKSECFD